MTKKKAAKKPLKKAKKSSKVVKEIHVLNGANLNMLGFREPEIYGPDTLKELEQNIIEAARETGEGIKVECFQTNYEGELLEYIHMLVLDQREKGALAGVIINPGAWTHTSVALRDAILMLKPVPIVEVHLSNLAEREEFRHYSFLEDIVDYRVIGMGQEGYIEALRWLFAEVLKERPDLH